MCYKILNGKNTHFARLLSQAHMLKINRDHRARLVSSNHDTILFLYAGEIRGASSGSGLWAGILRGQ